MEVVGKLLSDKGIPFRVSGRDYVVKCFNEDHEDSNPSMRIDKTTGVFNCFSCGYKGNLFKKYDVNPPLTSIKMQKLKEKLHILKAVELKELEGARPYKQKYRNISPETLTRFGAFTTSEIKELEDRLIFPITDISGKIRVYVARHTLSDAQPKYLYYPAHVRIGCFPEKINSDKDYIILVEGIFDALNLYDKGVDNVVVAFGTQSLKSNIGNKLAVYKVQGIRKVYLFFDGDYAGKTASEELKPLIEAEGFEVEILNCPDDEDPGSMTVEDIETLKAYIK